MGEIKQMSKEVNPEKEGAITPDKPKRVNAYILIGIAFLILITLAYYPTSNEPLVEVDRMTTSCIANNSVFYGADWCGHCQRQKEMFGDNVKLLNYIECEENKDVCTNKKIKIYPTWDIKGERYTGVQSVEKLKGMTGC